jgi:hypothetical protein
MSQTGTCWTSGGRSATVGSAKYKLLSLKKKKKEEKISEAQT